MFPSLFSSFRGFLNCQVAQASFFSYQKLWQVRQVSSIISAEELQILNIILIFTANALFVVFCFDLILEVDVHVLALLHFCTPLLLLLIHREKTRVNANRNRNPNRGGGGGGYESAIAPIYSLN